jgi:hypothetical protein
MNPRQIIQKVLGKYLVLGKSYPKPLPKELQDWYCYTSDGGHSIVCVLKQHYRPGADLIEKLVPVPVKSVLRGYEQKGGYIVVDLPYSSEIGLMVPPGDDEF